MGFIKYASDVTAPTTVAFAYADNPRSMTEWLTGAEHVSAHGEIDRGRGAQYRIRFRFGLWRPVLTCEITEYRHDAVIGYTLAGGPLTACLTLRFDPLGRGRSVLTSELDYTGSRGFAAPLRDRPRRALLRSALGRSESRLRAAIEELHGTDLVGRLA